MFSAIRRYWRSFSDSCKYLGASLTIVMVKRKLRRRPDDWSLWLMLGRLYEIGCQWPQALDALKRARKLNPHSQVIVEVLARVQQAASTDSKPTSVP
jgi:cytochrome c-type biogenesis protein CcmH/NrfG